MGAQRPARHRQSAVVADQHPPHRRNARPRHRDRATSRSTSPADRRDPAPARARRRRARRGAVAAVAAPAGAASERPRACSRCSCSPSSPAAGLPINTRYAFLAAAILCVFCGAGVFGWTRLTARAIRAGAGGWRAARSCSWRCSPTPRPSTARRTANWTNWRASSASKTTCSRSSRRLDHAALRAGRRAQPRAHPAARAVPEDEPREHRQRPGPADRLRGSTSTPRAAKSNRTTCSTPTTRTCRVSVPPGFTEVRRQPLVAGLRALP